MGDEFEAVAEAIDRARQLLLDYGRLSMEHLLMLSARLRIGDKDAVVWAFSEATGGMGSLNDQYLHPQDGDKIAEHEVEAVNQRLRNLVRHVEATARAAATANGIPLIR